MRVAAFAVLGLFLLAGCSNGGGKDAAQEQAFEELGAEATKTTGILRGVVVDDAIRPIAGASILLRGGDSGDQRMATNEQGLFAFDGLAPGSYLVSASKGGYVPAQGSSDVVAGVNDPPILKLLLQPDASFKAPYFEQYVFDGFIECSFGAAVDAGDYGVENACSESVQDVQPFVNSQTFVQYQLSGSPAWVQSETVWESTQAASRSLNHNFAYPDEDELDGWADLGVDGPSPLLNTMDADTAAKYSPDGTLTIRMFPWTDEYPGPIIALQQRFTVVTTIFYGYEPPMGWLAASGDAVPQPPA